MFRRYFPVLENYPISDTMNFDKFARKAYYGGWCYVNPDKQNCLIGKGIGIDVNGMYPYIMVSKDMPYGVPTYHTGEPNMDSLFICHIKIYGFELKDNRLPCIPIQNKLILQELLWLSSDMDRIISDEEYNGIELYITSIDLKMILDNYYIECIEYIDYLQFRKLDKLFKSYITHHQELKSQASKDGDKFKYKIHKLFSDTLSGKFAQKDYNQVMEPSISEDGVVKMDKIEFNRSTTIYVPVSAFITAYAREKIIRSAEKYYDRFVYSDTDSIYLQGDEIPLNIDIDPYEIGKFKIEKIFDNMKVLKQKVYFIERDGKIESTLAGCNKYIIYNDKPVTRDYYLQEVLQLNINTINDDIVIPNAKTVRKRVPNGVMDYMVEYTIKL